MGSPRVRDRAGSAPERRPSRPMARGTKGDSPTAGAEWGRDSERTKWRVARQNSTREQGEETGRLCWNRCECGLMAGIILLLNHSKSFNHSIMVKFVVRRWADLGRNDGNWRETKRRNKYIMLANAIRPYLSPIVPFTGTVSTSRILQFFNLVIVMTVWDAG
jgi:hypothetical protein